MITRRNFTISLGALPWFSKAMAQDNRHIRKVVVPWPAGASADNLARIFAQALAKKTGDSVIVENRPGAAGIIGATHVTKSPGDGRTILYTVNHFLNQEFLLKDANFKPLQELLPFSKVCDIRVAVVTSVNNPANDLREFIAIARKNPGKYSFAYYGGMGCIDIVDKAGINLLRVPYQGGAPGLVDVATGTVDIIDISLPSLSPLLKAGKLKLLAVMTKNRWPEFPDVPTVLEILHEYKATYYQCIFLPFKTPQSEVDSLWRVTSSIFSSQEYRRSVEDRGMILDPRSPEQFKSYILDDYANIKNIVEKSSLIQIPK